jgi:hypothetical protein
MPLGDIAGEALGGVFRVIARIVFEIVVEWLLRGTGRRSCACFAQGTRLARPQRR